MYFSEAITGLSLTLCGSVIGSVFCTDSLVLHCYPFILPSTHSSLHHSINPSIYPSIHLAFLPVILLFIYTINVLQNLSANYVSAVLHSSFVVQVQRISATFNQAWRDVYNDPSSSEYQQKTEELKSDVSFIVHFSLQLSHSTRQRIDTRLTYRDGDDTISNSRVVIVTL